MRARHRAVTAPDQPKVELVIAYHHVEAWPAAERDQVHRFLVAVTDIVVLDAEDAVTWRAAVAALAAT